MAFARPHDLELHRHSTGEQDIEATVRYVNSIGPLVRLELARKEDDELIQVELTQERYRELQIKEGERVFVKLQNLRLFLADGA